LSNTKVFTTVFYNYIW